MSIAETLMLAVQYHQAGHFYQAEQLYRNILQSDPRHVDALQLLGLVAYSTGRSDLAVQYLREALRHKPEYAAVRNNLCNILTQQGLLDEAIAGYREAIRLKPDYFEAHNNLGIALLQQGDAEASAACCREAIRLRPDYAEAHNNLGNALKHLGAYDQAWACYQQAIRIRPSCVEGYDNLGILLMEQGNFEAAIPWYRQALSLDPNFVQAHYNLGATLASLGRRSEASACYDRALHVRPDYAEAHAGRAFLWLQEGDFERGWPEYEWRWKSKLFKMPAWGRPVWDGSPLAGRTILLHPEQGLGDIIQFIRYASLVKEAGGTVLMSCPPALGPLLQSCPGIDRLVGLGPELPHFDVHAPLMSLPAIFKTTLATIPAKVPYLFADPELIVQWRRQLDGNGVLKIGIAWQGNSKYKEDRLQSIPLIHFAPLATLPHVRLFSLQKGPGVDQLPEATKRFPITELGSRLDEAAGAFMDTAAVIKNLDLVVTADTAIAHLAGALDVPVYLALSCCPDFRWLLDREDSPWYSTMRLFRQRQLGNWAEVFERIVAELTKMVPR
jgi:tetratricopeptide (TPR) repeat protein